jgi:hypothetical protein
MKILFILKFLSCYTPFHSFTLCEPFFSECKKEERSFLGQCFTPLWRNRWPLKKRMTAKGIPFRQSTLHSFASQRESTHCVADSEVLATLGTTGCQNAATVLCSHAGTETMLVQTAMIVRLKSHLHSA